MLGDQLKTPGASPGRRSKLAREEPNADKAQKEIDAIRGEVQKLVEIQKIVEGDDNLGIPEAQAALEVIHHFNMDMGTIESNMRNLVQLME